MPTLPSSVSIFNNLNEILTQTIHLELASECTHCLILCSPYLGEDIINSFGLFLPGLMSKKPRIKIFYPVAQLGHNPRTCGVSHNYFLCQPRGLLLSASLCLNLSCGFQLLPPPQTPPWQITGSQSLFSLLLRIRQLERD